MAYNQSNLILNRKIVTTNYGVTDNDFTIVCDATSYPITIMLPDPLDAAEQIFDICVLNTDHKIKVVTANGLINDAVEFVFNDNPFTSISVQAIEGNYYIVDVHYVPELVGCCHIGSDQQMTTEYYCDRNLGTWDGSGVICPTLLGACIYNLGTYLETCSITMEDYCNQTGGEWQGPETECPLHMSNFSEVSEDNF